MSIGKGKLRINDCLYARVYWLMRLSNTMMWQKSHAEKIMLWDGI